MTSIDMHRRLFAKDPPLQAPLACLAELTPDYALVQDFQPLSESLASQVARAHWARRGTAAFAEEQVPFVVTSDGYLSSCAAGVLFVHCQEIPVTERIVVLELGAGSGLFAKLFLDIFRDMCRGEGHDYYDRLTYLVTDSSETTVQQWDDRAVFGGHVGHVRAGVCSAAGGPVLVDGVAVEPHDLRAVFANYILDILPASVVRRSDAGAVEELCSRVWIDRKSPAFRQHGLDDEHAVRALLEDGSVEGQERLERLAPELTLEAAFRQCTQPVPYADEAIALMPAGIPGFSSHGALDALAFWQGKLQAGGFILLADYGPLTPDAIDHAGLDRFGPTVAVGLNFPLLEAVARVGPWDLYAPPSDAELPIHPRLIVDRPLPQTVACFEELYDGRRYMAIETMLARARQAAQDRQLNEAAHFYRLAVESRQTDWRLLGEIADFMHFQIHRPLLALDLARSALALNPWYSAALWNVYGDALFDCGRPDDAHEAYLSAATIHPSDIRAKFGQISTLAHRGNFAAALATVASALALDHEGFYSEKLLAKQLDVLNAASANRKTAAHENPRLLPSAGAIL